MAVFRDPYATNDLDWMLFQNGPIVLYWRESVLQRDLAWFRSRSYQIDEVNCSGWQTEEDFHVSIKSALGFPDYYGRNLNALADSLQDIEVPEDSGRLLVYRHYDLFFWKDSDFAERILDYMAWNTYHHLLFGLRFFTFLQVDEPRIGIRDVGAHSLQWNPSEWLSDDHDPASR